MQVLMKESGEKMIGNPFAINFGTMPAQYIGREMIIEEIVNELNAEPIQNPCFMLTGVRGTGKTVTMTAIENRILEDDRWIVIRLNPLRDMLTGLAAKLYDRGDVISSFITAELNLSKFGIGLNISERKPAADIESALEKILREIQRKKMRLLVTVDEVSGTSHMKEFASSYQLLIRQGLPVFLIMAGLYENIHSLENENNLTFLYRTPKYEMEPLNITLIRENYQKLFNLSFEEAMEMALITKGYPFAYQALGKYVWDSEERHLSERVLIRLDEALAHYVYNKIWSELSEMDRFYLSFLTQKESMTTAELLELTSKKKNEFSQYRARLRDKGLIDVAVRGSITLKLPRFAEFIKQRNEFL